MLDLTKLTGQMQGLSQHLTQEAAASRQRLELAQKYFHDACNRQNLLVEQQKKWRDRILFANATPAEPLNTCTNIPTLPRFTPSSPRMAPKFPPATTKLLTVTS